MKLLAFICSLLPFFTARADCSRLVTLSPSLTEIAYALELGDSVVGVTSFAAYPAAVLSKPKVGGLLDPNFEAILMLKPSLILALDEFRGKVPYLESLGFKVQVFDHRHLSGILASISDLAAICGQASRGLEVKGRLESQISALAARVTSARKPRTLVVVGESSSNGAVRSFYLSGKDGFYADLLRIAGAENVVQTDTYGSSGISAEGVLSLHPEAIIQILTPEYSGPGGKAEVLKQWKSVPGLEAAIANRIYIFDQDYASVPGPRLVKLAGDFARVLHPEIKFDE